MKNTMWSVVVLVILGGIAAAYYYWQTQVTPPPAPVSQTEAPPAPAKAEPAIRHPVQAAPSTGEPLPPLAESDAAMRDTLAELFTRKLAEEVFDLKDIVRRFVVTVDNLPRKKVLMQ